MRFVVWVTNQYIVISLLPLEYDSPDDRRWKEGGSLFMAPTSPCTANCSLALISVGLEVVVSRIEMVPSGVTTSTP